MLRSKYLNLYILTAILVILFTMSFFVAVGSYTYENGVPIDGTYTLIEGVTLTLKDLFLAPINGIIGILDEASHNINYSNSGTMSGSINLMILVLCIGAYMQMVNKSKILYNFVDAKTNTIAKNLNLGIFILMLFFLIGATTNGMYETTVAYVPILILLFDSLRINRIEIMVVMLLPLAAGHIGGTINPFATGIASDLAGVSIIDGIELRIFLLVVLFFISYFIAIRRLSKYELGSVEIDETKTYSLPLLIFFFIPFIILIYAFVPNTILNLDFIQVGIVFLMFTLILGLLTKHNLDEIIDNAFIGIKDFFIVAFAIGFARGIYVLLYNSYMSDTFIFNITNFLDDKNIVFIIIILLITFLVLGFLIPSTSALAMVSIPIIASSIVLLGYQSEMVVTIYQAMIGTLKMIAPTSPVVIAMLTMTGIKFGDWFKVSFKYALLFLLISATSITIYYGFIAL